MVGERIIIMIIAVSGGCAAAWKEEKKKTADGRREKPGTVGRKIAVLWEKMNFARATLHA